MRRKLRSCSLLCLSPFMARQCKMSKPRISQIFRPPKCLTHWPCMRWTAPTTTVERMRWWLLIQSPGGEFVGSGVAVITFVGPGVAVIAFVGSGAAVIAFVGSGVVTAVIAFVGSGVAVTTVVTAVVSIVVVGSIVVVVDLLRMKPREENSQRNTWTKASSLSLIICIKRQCFLDIWLSVACLPPSNKSHFSKK